MLVLSDRTSRPLGNAVSIMSRSPDNPSLNRSYLDQLFVFTSNPTRRLLSVPYSLSFINCAQDTITLIELSFTYLFDRISSG